MARMLTLAFEEYPDDEIVVRLSPVPLAVYFDIAERFEAARDGPKLDDIREMFQVFGDAGIVESWTFPEAPDGAGMLQRDFGLATQMINQWLRGVGDVPLPLPLSASAGTPSTPEASRRRSRRPRK